MSHVDDGTLHAYLDGELPSTERAAVEAHFAQCTTCRAALAEERALLERASALLGSARPVERPMPPFEQIRRTPKRSPWRVRTSFAWAASIMLALGLGYYLRSPGTPSAALYPAETARIDLHKDEAPPASAPALGTERQEPRPAPARQETGRRVAPPPTNELARLQSSADSVAAAETPQAAAGAVALRSSTQLRNAAPAPVRRDSALRLDEIVVTSAQSGEPLTRDKAALSAALRRTGTTQWQIISRGAATTLLGTDPVGLPGLATRRIRRSPAPDATVVVEQALDSSTVIQIFQRPAVAFGFTDSSMRHYTRERAEAAPAAPPVPLDRLARFVGRLRVEIAGPLSLDSLNRLLEQVEPLP